MSIRARLPGTLRMVFHGAPPAADGECATPEVQPPPFVEVTLYADDCVAFGRLPLSASRVTDLLNDGTEFELVDAFLQAIDDSHAVEVRTVVVGQDEIFAVAVAGPRGDPTHRTRTRPIPVELHVGRYYVSGNIRQPGRRSALQRAAGTATDCERPVSDRPPPCCPRGAADALFPPRPAPHVRQGVPDERGRRLQPPADPRPQSVIDPGLAQVRDAA